MTQGDALFQAILADPDDDGIRLVYADWLEENGQPDRAEFIRVQVELARLSEHEPRPKKLCQREHALLEKHREEWLAPVRAVLDGRPSLFARLKTLLSSPDPLARREGSLDAEFRRGFVENLWLPVAEFIAHAPALFAAAPLLRGLSLWSRASAEFRLLSRCPWLARVQRLYLNGEGLIQATVEGLVDSPHVGRLRELCMSGPRLDGGCLRVITGGRLMRQLTSLTMPPWSILNGEDVRALAESPGCQQLQTLELGGNAVADSGAAALAASPYLSGLTDLGLRSNSIGDFGAAALAGSPHLSGLAVLRLDSNQIGDAGARALAFSTGLTRLKILGLTDNPIGRAGAIPLAARFGSRVRLKERRGEGEA